MAATAYIDYHTMYVYRLLNYMAIGTGSAVFWNYVSTGNMKLQEALVYIPSFWLFIIMQVKWKFYGAGDGYLFIANSLFMIPVCGIVEQIGEILLIHMFLSCLLFIMIYIKQMDWKRRKLKEEKPFAPSIAAASLGIFLYFYVTKRPNLF